MPSKVTFADVLQNRGFKFLWFNQILVQLAYNTLNFALIIWVFKLMGANLAVSALLLSIYLPVVLFGIFAGVFVDIADRRKIIMFIDAALAVCFLLFIFIKFSYPLILINTFIINSLAQFFLPSENSSIPMLLSKKQLFLANSLFSLTLYGSFMLGFTMGGPILNHLGINAVFYLGAILLSTAFVLANQLPVIKVAGVGRKFAHFLSATNIRRTFTLTVAETQNTFGFIKGKLEVAVAIALMSVVQGVIGVTAVIMPAYFEQVLRIRATDSSYFVMLPVGLGMVTGAFLVGRLFYNRPKRLMVMPAIIISGILLILAGLAPLIAHVLQSTDLPIHMIRPRYFLRAPSLSIIFAIGAFVGGFCMVAIVIPCQTVLQELTPEASRGKIFSVLAVVMTAFAAVPVILAGGLSDMFGVTPFITAIGFFVVIVGAIVAWPDWFFKEHHLPYPVREFLGLGHWNNDHQKS